MRSFLIMVAIVALHIVGVLIYVTRPVDPDTVREIRLTANEAYGFGYVSAASETCGWVHRQPENAEKQSVLKAKFADDPDRDDGVAEWRRQTEGKSPAEVEDVCDGLLTGALAKAYGKSD